MRHHQDVAGSRNFRAFEGMRRVPQEHGKILMTGAIANSARRSLRLTYFPDNEIDPAA